MAGDASDDGVSVNSAAEFGVFARLLRAVRTSSDDGYSHRVSIHA